jgi:hypothetical protein
MDTLPPTQQVEYALVHDARALRDTAHLSFPEFDDQGLPGWVVATVTPEPESGSATVPGAYINAETGKFTAPDDAAAIVLKKGGWKKLSAAKSAQSDSGLYSWNEPFEQEKRTLMPEDYYSPFAFGGTIVFRPTPDESDLEQFGPVHLIFPEWAKYVGDAAKIFEQHKDRFEKDQPAAYDASQLEQLLAHDNPLVRVFAFRRLVELGKMTTTIAEDQIRRADVTLAAILCYLLLMNSKADASNPFLPAMSGSLQTSQDVDRIRSFALGSFSASLFLNQPPVTANSREVLKTARARLETLAIPRTKQADIPLIFQKMGIERN